jgi:hypothetical protein
LKTHLRIHTRENSRSNATTPVLQSPIWRHTWSGFTRLWCENLNLLISHWAPNRVSVTRWRSILYFSPSQLMFILIAF